MRAAGLRPKRRQKWTRQSILAAIRERSQNRLPMTGVWKYDKRLYEAARRYLGSWHNAIQAAGLKSNPPRKWSRQQVIEGLEEWRRQPYVFLRKGNRSLYCAVTRYFGNLQNALEAAGLESHRREWTEQRVIEAIQDGYVKSLSVTPVGFGNRVLAAAAYRRFGNWRNALVAAGLSHQAPKARTTWTRRLVVVEIRRRHQRGLPMTAVWRDNGALGTAAYRLFGSWHTAMAAAGLVPGETDDDSQKLD